MLAQTMHHGMEKGFSASMPAEATFKDTNPSLHSDEDLISKSGGNADHAALFAKLGVAYAVEMSL